MATEIKMDMSMIFLKINLTDRHNSTFSHSILKKENKIPKIDAKLQEIHFFLQLCCQTGSSDSIDGNNVKNIIILDDLIKNQDHY
jgi:hypothetical protein